MGKKDTFEMPKFDKAGVENLKKVVENFQKQQENIMKPLLEERQKLTKPEQLKNIELYGKSVGVIRIIDGRVVLNFSNIEDSKLFYEALKSNIDKLHDI